MTNKSPYEIRLDVLKMAQDMLDREMHLKERAFNHSIETMREINIGGVHSYVEGNAPQMYSPDDVIKKASELYGFVADSSSRNSSAVINNVVKK